MSNGVEVPKLGFIGRLKIAFSDAAAVARVQAVTEALTGEKNFTCDPDDMGTHDWNKWGAASPWGVTTENGKQRITFYRQTRICERCKLEMHHDRKNT